MTEQKVDNSLITVVVIEDDPAARQGLVRTLEAAGYAVVAEAADLTAAGFVLSKQDYDVVLIDLDLYGEDATCLITRCKAESPAAKVIVISALGDDTHALRAIRGGADGFVIKSDYDGNINRVIHAALADEPPLSPAIARVALRALRHDTLQAQDILSPRELQMLRAIAMGYSNKEIAEQHNLSYHTVVGYVRSTFTKLEVNNRSEAIMAGLGKGLLNP